MKYDALKFKRTIFNKLRHHNYTSTSKNITPEAKRKLETDQYEKNILRNKSKEKYTKKMEVRNHIKLHHYKTYLREIIGIIISRYGSAEETRRDFNPRIRRMKHKTQWIREAYPQLARSVNVIGDYLMEAHDTATPNAEGIITIIHLITREILHVIKMEREEDRHRELRDLIRGIEGNLPPASLTFINLINSAMHI